MQSPSPAKKLPSAAASRHYQFRMQQCSRKERHAWRQLRLLSPWVGALSSGGGRSSWVGALSGNGGKCEWSRCG
ncbi:hypothetical protein HN873_026626 [Arachis hypogaea]